MRRNATLGLSAGVMLLAGYGVWAASAWPWKAALFPLAIGVPMFCLAATEFLWALFGAPEKAADAVDLEPTTIEGADRRILGAAAWMLGFFAAIALLGFPFAVPLFLFLYLRLQGGEGWILSISVTLAVWAVFYGLFDASLHLPFPAGWLWEWLGMG
jgi:hypothetical protein